jgi:hypothetical protein
MEKIGIMNFLINLIYSIGIYSSSFNLLKKQLSEYRTLFIGVPADYKMAPVEFLRK